MQPPVCKDQSPQRVAARMRLVMDMHRDGVVMMRQTLMRRYPDDSPGQIAKRLADWLEAQADVDDPDFQVRPWTKRFGNC